MVEIDWNIIIVGILSGLAGAIIGPIITQRLTWGRIKKEFVLKKKIEYYEQISNSLEKDFKKYDVLEGKKKVRKSKENLEYYEGDKEKIIAMKITFFEDKNLLIIYNNYLELKTNYRNKIEEMSLNEISRELDKIAERISDIQKRILYLIHNF